MIRASSTLPTDDATIGSGVCWDRSLVEGDSSAQLERKVITNPVITHRESGSRIFGIMVAFGVLIRSMQLSRTISESLFARGRGEVGRGDGSDVVLETFNFVGNTWRWLLG